MGEGEIEGKSLINFLYNFIEIKNYITAIILAKLLKESIVLYTHIQDTNCKLLVDLRIILEQVLRLKQEKKEIHNTHFPNCRVLY